MTATDDLPERLPVSVLTGFLGSGKTTLLGRLIRQPDMGRTAVVINEFGEIGLDHELVESVDEDTVVMDSGCLCCTIRGDLVETLRGLIRKRAGNTLPGTRNGWHRWATQWSVPPIRSGTRTP